MTFTAKARLFKGPLKGWWDAQRRGVEPLELTEGGVGGMAGSLLIESIFMRKSSWSKSKSKNILKI